MRGFDDSVYRRLQPYVCALPSPELSPLNVNTLQEADAPLVSMLGIEPLPIPLARRAIAARPAAGWSREDFYTQPAFAETPLAADANQLKDQPTYFRLHTDVTYADAEAVGSALMMFDPALGRVVVVARRWGPEE
nr:type II secretion system protein GspK [Phenylobacterium sp. J426]